ncbi:MAG: BrnT family toxin [Bryobacterales bacterium]|nr:BrnT family toxin [Bryobacterales bacterium]
MASGIEFDWDDENRKHLAAHKVAPVEFEQVLDNDPIDLAFDVINDEERYRSVGLTNRGRLLSVAWTIRNGKVRAITAFPSGVSDRKAFLEKPK